ncbi:hypothetical protein NHF50_07965 [Flavobacterium sp. NRK F10]|uniref:hypothetical protein n=1 Tax=Flavobacterium sp. NRK F10 TaxID=2954931 RepID=UPI002091CD8F|nr:hypothetical protein [Flavobacterium sp. NRK F10]MCO6174981.1 hypothetical protein [Flavobacterium sp. NRK F10]
MQQGKKGINEYTFDGVDGGIDMQGNEFVGTGSSGGEGDFEVEDNDMSSIENNFDFDSIINDKDFNKVKSATAVSLSKVSSVTNLTETLLKQQIINKYKKGGDVIEALTDYHSLSRLKGANKFLQKAGYLGLAIDGLQLGSKIKNGTAQNSDYARFGINAALTFVAISNPIGLIAVGGYAVFDYYYGDQFWKSTGIDN